MLSVDDFATRLEPNLVGLVNNDADRALLLRAAPLVQERMQLLGEAPGLLGFLFTTDSELVVEPDALPGAEGAEVLDAALVVLPGIPNWTTEAIEEALRAELSRRAA